MEFNARYLLNGIFAVAVIVAAFGFVYWLTNAGGFGERDSYQVRFTVPVSGLSTGSDVLFNGIKVGQVEAVHLDVARPGDIIATISVLAGTPVRADTVAGVDFAGLTGAASILLTGGSAEAPPLTPQGGTLGVLTADPGQSRSWTQAAGRILGRLDDVLERNSGRFDAILKGLERLAGGGSDEPALTHDLPAAGATVPPVAAPGWQMAVAEPTVVLSLNTDRVLEQVAEAATRPLGEARWADSVPNLIQARLIESYENAGHFGVLRPADAGDPDYSLVLEIRRFWLEAGPQPAARIELVARITNRDGAIVATRHFDERQPAAGGDAEAAIAALAAAFRATAAAIVDWTFATLQ